MRKEIKEVIVFLVLTLFLSYFVFWGPIALFKIPTINFISGPQGPLGAIILFMIGGFVPSIVGIVLTAVYEGKKGVRNLFRRSFQIKFKLKWYLGMIATILILAFSLVMGYLLLGGKFDYSQFWIQLPTFIPLIILGPLSEEYGWRGFAIKRLLKNVSPNAASLIIGLSWSLWHLPLFYIPGSSQQELNLPFLVFLVFVTGISFPITYFYLKTNRSIFSAIFFHWIYTYVIQVVNSSITRTESYNRLEFLPALLIGIVFLVLMSEGKGNPFSTYD